MTTGCGYLMRDTILKIVFAGSNSLSKFVELTSQNKLMRKKLLFFCIALAFLLPAKSFSQSDSTSRFSYSGYVDVYYAYYTDSVGTGNYQKFPSVSPRSNQFGLNTALLTFQYDGTKFRGLVTLHYGDIARASWPSNFNNIMEAHAGVSICKKLWLDAGFFRTHVGTEGLLPKENFTSSVSVNTWHEPVIESGETEGNF